jgi:hypothetical protein
MRAPCQSGGERATSVFEMGVLIEAMDGGGAGEWEAGECGRWSIMGQTSLRLRRGQSGNGREDDWTGLSVRMRYVTPTQTGWRTGMSAPVWLEVRGIGWGMG